MSTRMTAHFRHGSPDKPVGKVSAIVYRHLDGYPDGFLPDFEEFLDEVEKQAPNDTRFNDPEYLAAKYVVWQAMQYGGGDRYLDFLSVGVTTQDPADIEYRYTIWCDMRGGRPQVTYEKVRG